MIFFFPSFVRAEPASGLIAEVLEDSELLKDANGTAESYGLLPKGTLVRVTGDTDGPFIPIEVELEQGSVEGWVQKGQLNLEEQKREAEAEAEAEAAGEEVPRKKVTRPTKKRAALLRSRKRVPKDEGLLLRRAPSFFYGLNAGSGFSLVRAVDGNVFQGIGFTGGAHVGIFVGREFPLRFDLGYTYLNMVDGTGFPVGFGFLDIGVSGAYNVNDIELFGRVHYAFGMSVTDLPGTLANEFDSVSQLGSIWLGAGAGYRFAISDVTHLTVRGSYSLSLIQAPFFYQLFAITAILDLQG